MGASTFAIDSFIFTFDSRGKLRVEQRIRELLMAELCVNIDHVATVRQARKTYEPDPVEAALEAQGQKWRSFSTACRARLKAAGQ